MRRRTFLKASIFGGLAAGFSSCADLLPESEALQLDTQLPAGGLPFKVSLAQWSLNNSLWSGRLDNLDFARYTRETFDIEAVEYVNQFFIDKATDTAYLAQMNQKAGDYGVTNVLIMVDMEGSLATPDEKARLQSVDNHYKWVDAAKFLGCHSIRVNAAGKGDREEVAAAAVDSLGRLAEYGAKEDISILVENHGGYSSDAAWLAGVMQEVDSPHVGTLPDFGNFTISLFPPRSYNPYQGMRELMPFAKGVSAKSGDFNRKCQDKRIDFTRMIDILRNFKYDGYVGIEYEGYKLSEEAGIKATKELLVRAAQ